MVPALSATAAGVETKSLAAGRACRVRPGIWVARLLVVLMARAVWAGAGLVSLLEALPLWALAVRAAAGLVLRLAERPLLCTAELVRAGRPQSEATCSVRWPEGAPLLAGDVRLLRLVAH